MESAEAAIHRLCAPEFEVSAHYLISITGRVFQLVDESNRAWHAGAGQWDGKSDVNSRSIGIELDNPGNCPFSEPMMITLETLLTDIMSRWRIPPKGVIAHSDLAIGRKLDPGPAFDWKRLALNGLSVWPQSRRPRRPDRNMFTQAAADFGYPMIAGLEAHSKFEHLLRAFRMRFAPWRDGPLCGEDMADIMELSSRFGKRTA